MSGNSSRSELRTAVRDRINEISTAVFSNTILNRFLQIAMDKFAPLYYDRVPDAAAERYDFTYPASAEYVDLLPFSSYNEASISIKELEDRTNEQPGYRLKKAESFSDLFRYYDDSVSSGWADGPFWYPEFVTEGVYQELSSTDLGSGWTNSGTTDTATTLTASAATGEAYIHRNITVQSGNDYEIVIDASYTDAAPLTAYWMKIACGRGDSSTASAFFDLRNGKVGTVSNCRAWCEYDITNSRFVCKIRFTAQSTSATAQLAIYLAEDDNDTSKTWAGTEVLNIHQTVANCIINGSVPAGAVLRNTLRIQVSPLPQSSMDLRLHMQKKTQILDSDTTTTGLPASVEECIVLHTCVLCGRRDGAAAAESFKQDLAEAELYMKKTARGPMSGPDRIEYIPDEDW